MKKKQEWWKRDNGLTQVDLTLKQAFNRRDGLEQMKAISNGSTPALTIQSLDDIPNFISPAQLAEKFGCDPETIRRDIRRNLLFARKRGRDYIIDPKDIPNYLERLDIARSVRQRRKSA